MKKKNKLNLKVVELLKSIVFITSSLSNIKGDQFEVFRKIFALGLN